MTPEQEDWARLTRWQKFTILNDWWIYPVYRWFRDVPMKIAWMLPRSVAMWAYIRVYTAVDPDPRGDDWHYRLKLWDQQTRQLRSKPHREYTE